MPTTQPRLLSTLAFCTALTLLACEEDGDRPSVDVSAIKPDPLPPEVRQPGSPGVSVVPSPRAPDAGVSTPPPPPPPVADAGRDAGLPLPPGPDPFGFDASLSPPGAR